MITSSGRVFSPKQVKKHVKPLNKEYIDFTKKCLSFGLSPDFYEQGCISKQNEFYYLVGFSHGYAVLRNLFGAKVTVEYSKAAQMMLDFIDDELENLSTKANMLYLEARDDCVREVKSSLLKQKKCIIKSLSVYNDNIEDILSAMNLEAKDIGFGVLLYNKLYEFISYRGELDSPYVLEGLDKDSSNPNRFNFVSYDVLILGLENYSNSENNPNPELTRQLMNRIAPVSKCIDIDVEAETGFVQTSLFGF